jgi:Acetyl-CoA hydrolase/transferase C-terminal domain
MRLFYKDLNFFRPRIVVRPQESTNSLEIARRLGVISINTALEVDIFGNVNSSHMLGRDLMNGISGSGDFTRSTMNAALGRAKDGESLASTVEPIFGDLIELVHMKALTKLLAKMPTGAPGGETENQFFQK